MGVGVGVGFGGASSKIVAKVVSLDGWEWGGFAREEKWGASGIGMAFLEANIMPAEKGLAMKGEGLAT
jgi:hypothetical protein